MASGFQFNLHKIDVRVGLSYSQLFYFYDISKGMGFNETAIRWALSHLNSLLRPKKSFNGKEATELKRAMDALNMTIPILMQQMMQPCDRLVRYCKWLNRLTPCHKLFHVVQSTYGYCCAFNYATK